MNAPTSMVQRASMVVAMLLGTLAQVGARAQDLRGSTLTVEFQLAALPQTLPLCDAPAYLARTGRPDYTWSIGPDDFLFNFADPWLYVGVTSPEQPSTPCTPYTLPTATALTARATRHAGGERSEIPASLSIDYARATLTVRIDATLLTPAELSVNSYAATIGYTEAPFVDAVDIIAAGYPTTSPGEFSVADASGDLFPSRTPSWYAAHAFLDLVSVTTRLEPSVIADPGAIGPAMTGAWMDPAQSGHGLLIEVLNDQRLLATWFTFTPDGTQQAWFIGVGTFDGNTATITDVVRPEGGRWIPNFDPAGVVMQPWGSLTITFSDCNHGRVQFDSIAGFGSGSMELTRLTLPAGLSCPSSTPAGDAR